MRLLVLDAALARCFAALVVEGAVMIERAQEGTHGQAAALPPLVEQVLAGLATQGAGALDGVAVGIGPGSFTGLRTAISLAAGMADARGLPLIGVSTGEALAGLSAQRVWACTENRRGQLFLERFAPGPVAEGAPVTVEEAALPRPEALTWIVGDGAPRAAARLRAGGAPVVLGEARRVEAAALAAVAERRLAGLLPPRAAQPLYVDPAATT
jgi:tRNA threonylcarbamoyladenosine biosynthesis protein TsaB